MKLRLLFIWEKILFYNSYFCIGLKEKFKLFYVSAKIYFWVRIKVNIILGVQVLGTGHCVTSCTVYCVSSCTVYCVTSCTVYLVVLCIVYLVVLCIVYLVVLCIVYLGVLGTVYCVSKCTRYWVLCNEYLSVPGTGSCVLCIVYWVLGTVYW